VNIPPFSLLHRELWIISSSEIVFPIHPKTEQSGGEFADVISMLIRVNSYCYCKPFLPKNDHLRVLKFS
jgi:hypothetical protein